ncbi:nuclear factor 7, brain-like isoform X2 [Protopterus annectens]|uniref:nuclear factor 7, brain-like isoform X2 n=1 Tax=Protopterus annectens TaxID=7888 RepID=UPI001CFAE0DA|nr:nuclear factor 7, brain-like isoform X2 [Protopterus annectens]
MEVTSGRLKPNVLEELTCSVCLELFDHPVTMECGHNFCKPCINRVLELDSDASCPQCRAKLLTKRYTVNRTLANVIREVTHNSTNVVIHLCETHMKQSAVYKKADDLWPCLICQPSETRHSLLVENINPECLPEPLKAVVESSGTCHQPPKRKAVIWKRSKSSSFDSSGKTPQERRLNETSDSITSTDDQEKINLELLVQSKYAELHKILNQLHEFLHNKEHRLIENIRSGEPGVQNEVLENLGNIKTASIAIREAISDTNLKVNQCH